VNNPSGVSVAIPEATNVPAIHAVPCHKCGSAFDVLATTLCSCIASDRSFVCPSCGACFCKLDSVYRRSFWATAPRSVREHKGREQQAEMSRAAAADVAAPEPARPLVLLVEDEPLVRALASRTIVSLGYGLVVASDGLEGLEMARRHRPELVLSDALMPRLDGRDMALRIKSDPQLAGTRVVVMTALYTGVKYRNEAYKTHKVDEYLSKPLHIEELVGVLEKYLG
jgi:CheY-like chemotaxis protein